jgi:sigma-B regulation protein RsbU (phosphoserine phosphatase)
MSQKVTQDFQAQAEKAASQGDWKAAAELYAQCVEQRSSELALINSVQQGLSSKLDMQSIYNLVGDSLRDTFNAQVVMISQYDPNTKQIFHHYAIERGQHLQIPGWQPIDSSRAEIIRTRKPFMINLTEISRVVNTGKMRVVPGTELPKTWLGVPLLVGNVARGVVSLQNLDKENAFSKFDIDLLVALTSSMSLSLENARLFNETERILKLMEAELQIARRTQRSILPLRKPRRAGYDFGSLLTTAHAVGGDFYDFIHLDKDRLGIVIGDVSGKGLPAALFMALTFSLLRAEAKPSNTPGQILRNINRNLLKMNASDMFVTLLFGILEYETGTLKYARAGHLLPIVLGKQGNVIDLNTGRGQPLGIIEEVQLDEQELVIPRGGLVLFFSDGLNEVADAQGNEFGLERIERELFVSRSESAKSICKRLWEAVSVHSDKMPNQDDFVTVVVKRQA